MNRILLCSGLLFASLAHAEVADSSTAGFTIKHTAVIAAPVEKVFATLLEVGKWWNSEHTYSGDAKNMTIDPRAGGCFCEKLEGAGSIEHMHVVLVMPSQMLRMVGALGPMQEEGMIGSLTWDLGKSGDGTKLTSTYRVGGYYAGPGMTKLSQLVDSVVGEQFGRLKNYIEKGKP